MRVSAIIAICANETIRSRTILQKIANRPDDRRACTMQARCDMIQSDRHPEASHLSGSTRHTPNRQYLGCPDGPPTHWSGAAAGRGFPGAVEVPGWARSRSRSRSQGRRSETRRSSYGVGTCCCPTRGLPGRVPVRRPSLLQEQPVRSSS